MKTIARDRTAEIRRLEQAYDRVDLWAAKRKAGIAAKLAKLKEEQRMV